MKKFALAAISAALMFVFGACDDSTSADSNGSNTVRGCFSSTGDPNFSCEVTEGTDADGKSWKQIKVNIPNYKGHVEKMTYDESGSGTQYYETSYFNLTPRKKMLMCLEFEDGIKSSSKKRNYTETYCDNGVSYFVITFENIPMSTIVSQVSSYEEDCEDYRRKWEDGDYDESVND